MCYALFILLMPTQSSATPPSIWIEYSVLGVVVAALVICALFLPPLSIHARHNGYQKLSVDDGVSRADLTLRASEDTDFSIRITPIDITNFHPTSDDPCQPIQVLPGYLSAVSVYGLETRGAPPDEVQIEVRISSSDVDMYGFDPALARWRFIPIQPTPSLIRAQVMRVPTCLALVRTHPVPLVSGMTIGNDERLDLDSVPSGAHIYPNGLYPMLDGSLIGALPGTVHTGERYHVIPLISNVTGPFVTDVRTVEAILGNTTLRQEHVTHLVNFATSDEYRGLAIDYRGLSDELRHHFSHFILDLGRGLHAQRQILVVIINPNADVYDWAKLGRFADEIVVLAPLDPQVELDTLLSLMTQQINRYQIHLGLNAHCVEVFESGMVAPLAFDQALGSVGEIIVGETEYVVGQTVTATRSYDIGWDDDLHAMFLQSGQSTRWLTGPSSLRRRMEVATAHQLGGVVIFDFFADTIKPGMGQMFTSIADVDRSRARWAVIAPTGEVLAESVGDVFVYEIPATHPQLEIHTQLLIENEWLTIDYQTLNVR